MVRGSDLAKLTASSLGKRMQRAAAAGKLYREKQFVIGIPAREMGEWDSDERILIQVSSTPFLRRMASWFWWIIRQIMWKIQTF